MKTRLIILAALLLGWTAAFAQSPNASIVLVTSAPSGSCQAGLPDQQVITTGFLYTCQSGTWAGITGGGGCSTFACLTGNLGLAQGPLAITGILLDTAGTLSQAVADTDFQAPITLTTTGTSGAATFTSDVLNIPQYTGLSNPMTLVGDMIRGGASGVPTDLPGPTTGTTPYNLCSTPSGGVATVPAWCLSGVGGRTVTGTTDTIALTDRSQSIIYNSASPVASAFTSPATLANNFSVALHNINAGAVTVTLGAGTFLSTGSATKVIAAGELCVMSSPDNVNIDDRCSSGLITTSGSITATRSATGIALVIGTNPVFTIAPASLSAGGAAGFDYNGTSLTAGSAYYRNSSGTLSLAEANAAATATALCLAVNTTQCVSVGAYRYSGTQGWTAGGLIYLSDSSAGALTQTAPTATASFVQVVGVASANDTINISPGPALSRKGSCTEAWGGSGTSFAMTSGDDAIVNNTCYNDSGVTRTITAVKCRSDNAANTTVLTPTFGAAGTGTAILTGTVTCGNSYAYSATGTVTNASWTTGTGIDPGMSTVGNATSIALIVEYTTP